MTELNYPALMQTAIQVPVQPRPSVTGSVAGGQTASTSSTLNAAVRRIFHIGPVSETSYAPSTIQAPSTVQVIIQEIPEASVEEEQCRQEHHHFRQRFRCFIASHEFCRQYNRDDKCSLARLSRNAS